MRTIIIITLLLAACDEQYNSNFHDAGMHFKAIGAACTPDTPIVSECGYRPQFYCTSAGICASACNTNSDCAMGSSCIGAGDMSVGECRITVDGGS